ncbi:MAG: phosphoribosylformylglycinamidine synthase subunit PurQ [Phycisphaerales bacterium]|nr:phosphoribosylformylglycinamidine synthase subunit PurQ [Phycisphaerales bacterium]
MPSPAPRALIIRAPGTNCEGELARAFTMGGATAEVTHLDALIADPAALERADLIGLPCGFSYGDDVASGRIFALRLKKHLYPALRDAVARGVPVFAVCNGFQIAVQAGLLPGPAGGQPWPAEPAEQEVSLTFNTGGRFIDKWVPIHAVENSVCIWTRGLQDEYREMPDAMMLPIAHGEGRLVARDEGVLDRLRQNGQVALRYGASYRPATTTAPPLHPANPNGSSDDIVGICDTSGRVFGLMPHPERYLDWTRHPFWTRLDARTRQGDTPGLRMFKNAVEAAQSVRA